MKKWTIFLWAGVAIALYTAIVVGPVSKPTVEEGVRWRTLIDFAFFSTTLPWAVRATFNDMRDVLAKAATGADGGGADGQ